MKIKNLFKNTTKSLRLKLIKTKIYKKEFTSKSLKIENILQMLKKAFQVIYKYHIKKKKILFLNAFFIQKMKNMLRNTKHTFLTQINWSSEKITNKILKKKYNLIVILDSWIDKNIKEEIYKAKIPIIILQNKIDLFNLLYNYRVPGDFSFNKKKIRDNFFLNLLKISFKKAKQRRRFKNFYKN